jgi:PAS domain S-box-containing protein
MESQLLESEERYRRLVELSPEGIVVQFDGKITFANESAPRLLEEPTLEAVIGRSVLEFIPASYKDIFIEKIHYVEETHTPLPFLEEQFLKKDGTSFDVEVALIPFPYEKKTAIQIIFKDITERKRSQEELKRAYEEIKNTHEALLNAEKLAALGRFSAGIAHEIRNPLANISASAQFCISKYEIDEKMKKHFDVILRNADTANRIIKELLDFTSPKDASKSKGNLTKVINHVCELINPRCSSENIHVIKQIDSEIPMFQMNETRLEEAFLNFLSNAIESMPGGGTLTVKAGIEMNNDVLVQIKDTGIGIPKDNLDKILEPFFTTKDHGTGLGLSLAYNAIKAHSGDLRIESSEERGTTINIQFPLPKSNGSK